MSILAVGVSHRTAPITTLERVALDASGAEALGAVLSSGEHVEEAVVLATCNRVEVYADVATFHGGLAEVGEALAGASGIPLEQLKDNLYVHYEDRAVAHLFTVACGLDSMAVGEGQILGQVRQAHRVAQDNGTAGRVLDHLLQQALRVGKRAHSETGIDRAGGSLVDAALERAARVLGPLGRARALVVGAGSMSALAATTLHRVGVGSITVANRTPERAQRLAAAVEGRAVGLDALGLELSRADLVVSCTGAVGHVLTTDEIARAREGVADPVVLVDLALPRDVEPSAADRPGVTVVDLEVLGEGLADTEVGADVMKVRDIVTAEVATYLTSRRAEAVAPTVVALRARADEVVRAELARLEQRLPDEVDPALREELRRTVRRVVDKLLHAPTVRVKELAGQDAGGSYAAALRELFDLDARDVAAVSDAREALTDETAR